MSLRAPLHSLCGCRTAFTARNGTPAFRLVPAARQYASSSSAPRAAAPPTRKPFRRALLASLALSTAATAYYVCESRSGLSRQERRLSPFHFTPLDVVSIEPLTRDTSLFTLAVPKFISKDAKQYLENEETISSLYVMQPDVQIQRPYTPLSASYLNEDGPEKVGFVVKRYADGEMSRWLHRLRPGIDQVRVKGPVPTWTPRLQDTTELVFIVGGTGVAPVYQYLERLSRTSTAPKTAIKIIYASQSPASVLLRDELDALIASLPTSSQPVSIKYLVDRTDGAPLPSSSSPSSSFEVGLMDRRKLSKWLGAYDPQRLLVVCGPDGMINYVAGPRPLPGRPIQGAQKAGGLLGQLGYEERQVVKL